MFNYRDQRVISATTTSLVLPVNTGFVYIAGPYLGKLTKHDYSNYHEIDSNINEACKWAARMATDGIPYFCPHLNSAHMEVIAPNVEAGFWLDLDMRIMKWATVLFMLPNWRESEGARVEFDTAKEWEMPIYTHNTYDKLVNDWRYRKEIVNV